MERQRDVEFARKRIKAGILISRLNKASSGKLELTKSQLEATKMLLDKAVPSLQAIEQTNIDPMGEMSEEDIREQVRALITLHPWLLEEFRPGIKQEKGSEDVVSPQQTQRNMDNAA